MDGGEGWKVRPRVWAVYAREYPPDRPSPCRQPTPRLDLVEEVNRKIRGKTLQHWLDNEAGLWYSRMCLHRALILASLEGKL